MPLIIPRSIPAALLVGAIASVSPKAIAEPRDATSKPDALPTAAATADVQNSRLDALLLYQILIGEMQLRQGDPQTAQAIILDAANRSRDEMLYERATELALRARLGEEALVAVSAWRTAHPRSIEPVRQQIRILLALGRLPPLAEPMRRLVELTPEDERASTIAVLPRLLRNAADQKASLQLMQSVLLPLAESPVLRTPAQLALARALLQAGRQETAFALTQDVARRQPQEPGAALLALEMLPGQPQAQSVVVGYLAQPKAEPLIRLGYAQWLSSRQQQGPALVELRQVVQQLPDSSLAWLQLGSAALETHERGEAEAALRRFLALDEAAQRRRALVEADTPEATEKDGESRELRTQALLMLAQLAAEQGNFPAAHAWLEPLRNGPARTEIELRRAMILAQQGRVEDALSALGGLPEGNAMQVRGKLLAQAQVLRTSERWAQSLALLSGGLERFAQDTELMYELALVHEKLGQHEPMEALLRRIIEIRPDHHHAHNALGYSLAERGIRLDEAGKLIERALELSPGDPFITDSLAWVAFRQGKLDAAAQLLRQAYAARPDAEIGAHLGEVLWAQGLKDEARQIWRESRQRDGRNKVLQETLARLKIDL